MAGTRPGRRAPGTRAGWSPAAEERDGDERPATRDRDGRGRLHRLVDDAHGALVGLADPSVGIQPVWERYVLGSPVGGSCHIDVAGENSDPIGVAGALCTADSTQTARLRDFGSTWAKDLATGTTTAAYCCTDATVVATCGSTVRDLVDRSLPLAAPIR